MSETGNTTLARPEVGERRIGPLGTASRLVVGAGLLIAAALLGIGALDAIVGLGAANLVVITVLAVRGWNAPPLRATGPSGHCVNLAIGAAFFSVLPVAAMLFYGSAMLVAALTGAGGCEMFAVSNLIRRRDDQIGCPVFAPVDAVDAGHRDDRSSCCGRLL